VQCFRCHRPGEPQWSRGGFSMMRCPTCAQRFVSPRSPGFQELYDTDDYFDGMNRTNRLAAWFRRRWFTARHARLRRSGSAGHTLVEIGPSWGEFVSSSIDEGYRVAASEFSAGAARVVSQRYGVPVQQGPFRHGFFVDHGFSAVDAVCMWDVIEHVPDPPAFLGEVARVCAPGTVVGFSCPDVSTPLARMMGRRWHTFKPDEHLWHFDQATVTRLFDEAGFDVTFLTSSPLRMVNLLRFDCMTGVAVRRGEPAAGA
jgi:SAM-dependent methyltransferase